MIIGGAQENTLLTVEGLCQKSNYEVTLITGPEKGPEGDLLDQLQTNPSFQLIIEPSLRRNIHPIRDVVACLKLFFLFRRSHFDIVHTHSSKAGVLARLAAHGARVPVVIHTIHGLPFYPYQNKMINLLYRILERWAARWTDRIITVADAMRDQAVQAKVAPLEKFTTIRSGMNLNPFLRRDYDVTKIRSRLGIGPQDCVIGKIARLFHLKGHEYLIEAAQKVVAQFPEVKFLLVGDGILKESLIEKIKMGNLERNFIFTGLVQPEEIPQLISAMDLVVHVSLREGLAKVLPQALASGKPVISFDIDGAREVVQEGINGFLIPPCDTLSLSEAMIKFLKDADLSHKMGQKGMKFVDPYFRKEYMVEQIEALYSKLLTLNLKL
ncbi:MAG: glycosyltransferase family 4 protein [Chlamydiae bacterium]|nr:glycosyltransferase family 4 protein [Chlamydiota bacterium]MBI3277297.1 glycosyltransferase family 4 protein [Chlamydiota bacterium]